MSDTTHEIEPEDIPTRTVLGVSLVGALVPTLLYGVGGAAVFNLVNLLVSGSWSWSFVAWVLPATFITATVLNYRDIRLNGLPWEDEER